MEDYLDSPPVDIIENIDGTRKWSIRFRCGETQKYAPLASLKNVLESSLRYCYVDRIEAINAEGGIRNRPGKRNV
jgi:hypothetical protein